MAVESMQLMFRVAGSQQRLHKTFKPQKSGEAWYLIGPVSAEEAVSIVFQLPLDGRSAYWERRGRERERRSCLRLATYCVFCGAP